MAEIRKLSEVTGYNLTLTVEEAQVLLSLLGSICGATNKTYRGVTSSIRDALHTCVDSNFKTNQVCENIMAKERA